MMFSYGCLIFGRAAALGSRHPAEMATRPRHFLFRKKNKRSVPHTLCGVNRLANAEESGCYRTHHVCFVTFSHVFLNIKNIYYV